MPLLEVNTDEIKELEVLPEGEYLLQILSVEVKDVKSGSGQQLVVRLEAAEHPLSDDIYLRISLPNLNDTEKEKVKKSNRVAKLAQAFGIRTTQLNTDDLIGRSAWGTLIITESEQYGRKNEVAASGFTPAR